MCSWFTDHVIHRRRMVLEQLEERIVLDAASDLQNITEGNSVDPEPDQGEAQGSPAEGSGNTESLVDGASDPAGEYLQPGS